MVVVSEGRLRAGRGHIAGTNRAFGRELVWSEKRMERVCNWLAGGRMISRLSPVLSPLLYDDVPWASTTSNRAHLAGACEAVKL